jgi:hypothetical protein
MLCPFPIHMMKNYMSEQKENRASIGARSRRKWKKEGGRWKDGEAGKRTMY